MEIPMVINGFPNHNPRCRLTGEITGMKSANKEGSLWLDVLKIAG